LTLRGWAAEAGIAPATLADRLDRRHLPMARALATGILTSQESGRRGKRASPW
jgi:lambda repressor-like predicted transcriptional regulator